MKFEDRELLRMLDESDQAALDAADFGIVAMNQQGVVEAYNLFEARVSGLSVGRVVGKNFFESVAPCTNNFLVAGRFRSEPELDAVIDYVFTLRMRPTPVSLRLLRSRSARRQYLLVKRD